MPKKTPSLYLPNSDKDALVIARECLPAGKAAANPDTILRFALFEGKDHNIASAFRCNDRPLEFIKPQMVEKKTIPSRGLCQILIPFGAEKNHFSCYIGLLETSNTALNWPITQVPVAVLAGHML